MHTDGLAAFESEQSLIRAAAHSLGVTMCDLLPTGKLLFCQGQRAARNRQSHLSLIYSCSNNYVVAGCYPSTHRSAARKMITDIQCRSEIGPDLDRSKLNPYWQEYFDFVREARELHALSEAALTSALNDARAQPRPFLDAQQAISEILTRFGRQHNFHRQFNERFNSKPSQVLGMQLYEIVAQDSDWWVYLPTQHLGHLFPHATYFMPRDDAKYARLLHRHAI